MLDVGRWSGGHLGAVMDEELMAQPREEGKGQGVVATKLVHRETGNGGVLHHMERRHLQQRRSNAT